MKTKSLFLANLHYFYAKTDGTYDIPNSADGDLLKQAKVEIEDLHKENKILKRQVEELQTHINEW